jgi:hypothetical protein
MAVAPKTRKGERRFQGPIGETPLDRDPALPIPQVAPAARAARRAATERPAPTRWPRRAPAPDAAGREEYPGPRRAGSGARVEPGHPAPARGARKGGPKR